MITIYCCDNSSPEMDYFNDYMYFHRFKTDVQQWEYINEINKSDGCISVLPHSKSVLRDNFIEPHLNDDGYIKEYGKFSLEIKEETIYYELVNKSTNKQPELIKELQYDV